MAAHARGRAAGLAEIRCAGPSPFGPALALLVRFLRGFCAVLARFLRGSCELCERTVETAAGSGWSFS